MGCASRVSGGCTLRRARVGRSTLCLLRRGRWVEVVCFNLFATCNIELLYAIGRKLLASALRKVVMDDASAGWFLLKR